MADPQPSTGEEQTLLFRASKKRKIYRQRPLDSDLPNASTADSATAVPQLSGSSHESDGEAQTQDVEGTAVPVAEILRLRKLRKHRIGGVEFRAAPAATGGNPDDIALIAKANAEEGKHEEEEVLTGGIVRRFIGQTGKVGDVDKHMMAYIDSKLAERRQPVSPSVAQPQSQNPALQQQDTPGATSRDTSHIQRQPATLGKLLEIDLGRETHERNIARTEAAWRRLDGEVIDDDSTPAQKGKVRLGRDGKPFRSRKRRNSEDIRRDKIVEEVMRENRLEHYEPPVSSLGVGGSGGGGGSDGAQGGGEDTDDALAEAFRREFMDAVGERQRKKQVSAAPPRSAREKKEEEVLKGPKLGGSRNARAAMREVLLKKR